MKALSVVTPWGNLIANEDKSLEIRTWKPEQLPMLNVAIVQNSQPLSETLQEDENAEIVAIVDFVGVKPFVKADCERACEKESEFEDNWLAWEIANVRKLSTPIKAVAKRKIYELSDSELKQLDLK
tara:strand:- start:1700 stop:2077 length:378 start_codon:yes stop_codon:yes gene_type:complete